MKNKTNFEGIVLAAGFSTRMKTWKPGVIIDNVPLIFHSIKPMLKFCDRVIVVGGYNYISLEKLLSTSEYLTSADQKKIVIVENKKFMQGMFSSVQCGLLRIKSNVKGIFVTPADIPFIKKTTYEKLINCFENNFNSRVIIPITLTQRRDRAGNLKLIKGHPVLISGRVGNYILESEETFILSDILVKYNQRYCYVSDNGISFDIDDETDLKKVNSYLPTQ